MKKLMLFMLVVCIVAFISGQTISECCKFESAKTDEKTCSQVVKSLQLCRAKTISKIKEGENVVIDFTLMNLSENTIEIPRESFEKSYEIKIQDINGKSLISKSQKLAAKFNEGNVSMEELIRNLPVNSSPASTTIMPKQEIQMQINLSQFYQFPEKGKYQIEIKMRLILKNESEVQILTFGVIELEID